MQLRSSKRKREAENCTHDISEPCADTHKVVKTWEGSVRVALGYTGPPGGKNSRPIEQGSVVISDSNGLASFCKNLKAHYHEGSKGPAGIKKFTPQMRVWEATVKNSLWDDHIIVVAVCKSRLPHITEVTFDTSSRVLRVSFDTYKRCGVQEVQYGMFEAILVKYNPECYSSDFKVEFTDIR